MAEQAGFEALWISDHYHPWLDEQGQSGFVWSVIGAVSQVTSLPLATAVTCPIIRIHPVIIAQAAATASLLTGGRFTLGVGTGEALNEHVTGARWPAADERQKMLEEAVTVIRELMSGRQVTHHGPHYLIKLYRDEGGGDRTVQGGIKGCWAPGAAQARRTMQRLWATDSIPGEAAQLLPLPRHFGQLTELVTEDMISAPCGPDPEPFVQAIRAHEEAGFDEVYMGQVGGRLEGFFDFFASQVVPRLREG